jgi:diguanylate cyclase (GGDEF)-like protein
MLLTHSSLSTIPNRYAFLDKIEQLLENKACHNLFLIDIVRFSDVSSGFGYDFGDQILLEIANRLVMLSGPHAIFGRISGDIFGIIVSGKLSKTQLRRFYSHLIDHFKTPIQCADHAFMVDFNVGVATNPSNNKNINTFFSLAEMALRHAKSNKFDNFQYANDNDSAQSGRSLTLKADLTRAIDNDELEIYFQPKVELSTLKVVGAECLLRWHHPLDGVLFPGALIEAAESYNMMNEVGYWVLGAAFKGAARLNSLGLRLKLSVNMSPTQLYDMDFIQTLLTLSRTHGVELAQFELELTEDVALSNSLLVKKQLARIRELGMNIAIDDFGKGYSNLGYMRNIDIDAIKIDKSFVMEIDQDPINKAIVQATQIIANAANSELIAEGIENIHHLHILREIGVVYGQGFLFSKAVNIDNFIQLISQELAVGTSLSHINKTA